MMGRGKGVGNYQNLLSVCSSFPKEIFPKILYYSHALIKDEEIKKKQLQQSSMILLKDRENI